MHATAIDTPRQGGYDKRVALETKMLELFAPINARSDPGTVQRRINNAPLWRSDAIHRAKNLAQMTLSLAHIAEHPSRRWLAEDLVAHSRSLARAYEELSADAGPTQMLPCVPLLAEIASRLTLIFGHARDITIVIDAVPVSLVADMRRALILMCSEMVINALKYAFPAESGGIIHISLANADGQLSLVVEDNGVGTAIPCAAGQGSALLAMLGTVLGASVTRGLGSEGHGYRVVATMRANLA